MMHSIRECHNKCINSFEKLWKAQQASNQIGREQMPLWKVYDAYERYKSWATNNRAHQVDRNSLDHRLQDDTTSTKNLVLNLQNAICQILDECEW